MEINHLPLPWFSTMTCIHLLGSWDWCGFFQRDGGDQLLYKKNLFCEFMRFYDYCSTILCMSENNFLCGLNKLSFSIEWALSDYTISYTSKRILFRMTSNFQRGEFCKPIQSSERYLTDLHVPKNVVLDGLICMQIHLTPTNSHVIQKRLTFPSEDLLTNQQEFCQEWSQIYESNLLSVPRFQSVLGVLTSGYYD